MPSAPPYRVYAAEVSYFSGKVRPFFRYKNVPFEEIAPTPEVDRALHGTGLHALLTFTPRYRLGKRHFKLVFETA